MKKMRICMSSMMMIWKCNPIRTFSSTKIISSCRETIQLRRILVKRSKRRVLRKKVNPNNQNKSLFRSQS
jgi:hypothetical protein